MKRFALGWACNLNDIFVRFPYEKCKELYKYYKTKALRKQKVKQVFRTATELMLNDIIENNVTLELPSILYYMYPFRHLSSVIPFFDEQVYRKSFSLWCW